MQFAQRHHLTPSILVVLVVVTLSVAAGIYCRITRDPYLTKGVSDVTVTNVNTSLNANDVLNSNVSSATNNITNTSTDIGQWKLFSNDILGLSFRAPEQWQVAITTSDSELGQSRGDTRIVSNECETNCSINKDICEIGITGSVIPGANIIDDPRSYIQSLPSYKGESITESTLNGLTFLRTTVAVTPKNDDGMQGYGPYAMFGKSGGTRFFASAVSKGFSNADCITIFDRVLASVTVH